MNAPSFWDTFKREEIYLVRGVPVILTGYRESMDEAVFEDEDGQQVTCGPGLIRLVS